MGADWWKARKARLCITRYKHENFCASCAEIMGILDKNIKNNEFRIKNIN